MCVLFFFPACMSDLTSYSSLRRKPPSSSVITLPLQQGVIVSGDEEFFIEPLTPADNLTSVAEREGRPHVVYKRSSLRHQYMDQSCGVIGE